MAKGYYEVTSNGGVYAFGGAKFYGSLKEGQAVSPIVAITVTQGDLDYYLVAANGQVYAFGNAVYAGELPPSVFNGGSVVGASVA